MTDELEVAGYHIRIPAVDIHTVSAGGGSIRKEGRSRQIRCQ